MWDFLSSPEAKAVIYVAALVIMTVVGWYVVASFRDSIRSKVGTHEHLTFFRNLVHRGELSEDDFRNIKSQLGSRLRDEGDDNGKQG
ncbi:MAG: hypothetical protein R3E01_28695 [Pirellulaceae bacterium]|nr:hypothetical protein [Planctomycetales bacterium]